MRLASLILRCTNGHLEPRILPTSGSRLSQPNDGPNPRRGRTSNAQMAPCEITGHGFGIANANGRAGMHKNRQ